MLCRVFFFLFLFPLSNLVQANELKPFKTDGCSMWIDGPPTYPNLWRHCCVLHDFAYWQGGSKEQRTIADNVIQACVLEAAESKGMANYMHGMIRWGGSPYWISLYRWGYGWDYWDGMKPRGYKIPTIEEQQMINEKLPDALKVIEDDAVEYPKEKQVEKLVKMLGE